ncbi:carbamoyltransferase HypF [Kibdelosporangium lantanae]
MVVHAGTPRAVAGPPAARGHEAQLVEVFGVVQGVGFRPFVHRLATELGLAGDVRNVAGHVVIRVAGAPDVLAGFRHRLAAEAPPLSTVTNVAVGPLPDAELGDGFAVLDSVSGGDTNRDLPPDLATCEACLAELFDPGDRRFRYPFLNCTDCGPRATIVAELPYDRVRTTMSRFPLCPDCRAEYGDPANRRFHAEPIACPACGPRLAWYAPDGERVDSGSSALTLAVRVIANGGLVAVKGIGGYQLVCDAGSEPAVSLLRTRKHRPRKPFAVMVPDLAAAREIAEVGPVEVELLASPAAPIVLSRTRGPGRLARSVAPDAADVGLFLPYTPLHHLLLADLARPLVVTSGNRTDEPIAITDTDVVARLGPMVTGILGHDRPILSRYDDSVTRVIAGRPAVVRRARGYAPSALPLPVATPRSVLGLGGQLKHTTTLAVGAHAVLGPHTGDLADAATLDAFTDVVERFSTWQGVRPEACAHDLHPGYLSTRYATRWPADRRIPVQHHHAHIAATAAEHELPGPFLGLAFDGLGYGTDGTLWGGELLLADYVGFRRLGRFGSAPLPGGELAVRRPVRTALGYLFAAEDLGGPAPEPELAVQFLGRLPAREVDLVRRMLAAGLNSPRATSAGRLFDAVAALLGIRDDNDFEGSAAMALETAASAYPQAGALPWRLVDQGSCGCTTRCRPYGPS